jgi:hypothetical protein
MQDFWNTMKDQTYQSWVWRKEKRCTDNLFNNIIAEIFSNVEKGRDSQI